MSKKFREDAAYKESEANYWKYLRVKDEFMKEGGKVAVITGDEVICIADSMREAVKIANEKAHKAKHMILWKVGEDEEVKVKNIRGSWLRRR